MNEKELKKIAALYFGFTPTPKIPKSMEFEVLYPEELEQVDEAEKLKIKWENHIGTESGVARITPLDIMYYKGMKNTKANLAKAVGILKGLAKLNSLPLIRVDEKYLLVNPKHRR